MLKIGLLLSGCGLYDGTEVSEAVLAALALERAGARPVYLAPDVAQLHTVDHTTGSEVDGEPRNVLLEAARLARGRIRSLGEQYPGELAALVIPGGHGAVKNLMTNFATLDAPRAVIPAVRDLLAELSGRRAPIGSISLGRTVVQTFLGDPLSGSDMQMAATDVEIDAERRLVFTPGFLTGASLPDVAAGIDRLIGELLKLPSRELNLIH